MHKSIFEVSVQRYDQEISRAKHIDQKTSNQIGFIGIIIAVISLIYGSNSILNLPNSPNLNVLFFGIILLLISIGMGVLVLTPFVKSHPIFNIKKFYQDYHDIDTEETEEMMLQVYLGLIDDITSRNNQKSSLMYAGSWVSLAGLVISFISFLV